MLDWALRYIRLGWAVIPLWPHDALSKDGKLIGKEPIGELAPHGSKDATLNEAQARGWWGRYPEANIGVATGMRFFAVDVDIKHGGDETWEMLRMQHGAHASTIQQVTGTGGSHILFALPAEFPVKNSQGKVGPGIDIRGMGGYIVVAPSIHPETKRAYDWDGIEEIEQQKIAPAPGWLLKKLREDVERRPPVAIQEKIAEGGRNDTLFRIAAKLRRQAFSEEEIFATIREVNARRCHPPLLEAELRTIAASAARYAPEAKASHFASQANIEGTLTGNPRPDGTGFAETAEGEVPVGQADVEAAVQHAIDTKSPAAACDLWQQVAKLRRDAQVAIVMKLRLAFGDRFPLSQFQELIRGSRPASGGIGGVGGGNVIQMPPPPAGGGGSSENDGPDLLGYPLTDSGNGERLVAMWGHSVRWCVEMEKWLVWDGRRWAVDDKKLVTQWAKRTARRLYEQAVAGGAAFAVWARKSESAAGISAMLTRAATEPGIPISAQELDQHPYLLNCLNGVLDLRSGKLLEHHRELLITKLCPVEYDENATCEKFLWFLHWAMGDTNPEAEPPPRTLKLVAFLQRIFGYSLTADVSEKCVFIFYGPTANNGKSTLVNVFLELLGPDYSAMITVKTLMVTRGSDVGSDLADLRGARFVSASEAQEGDALNEAQLKFITGGMGNIKARKLYENFINFKQTHHLFLDCNHRPKVRGSDKGIWDRLKLIPFDSRVTDEQRDTELKAKMLAEAPGILAWAARGCREWIEKKRLDEPSEVSLETQAWQESDDPLREFLEDCCELGEERWEQCSRVSAAYLWWCKQNSERYPIGRSQFTERMKNKGFKDNRSRRTKDEEKHQLRTWEGITLKAEVWSQVSSAGESKFRSSDLLGQ